MERKENLKLYISKKGKKELFSFLFSLSPIPFYASSTFKTIFSLSLCEYPSVGFNLHSSDFPWNGVDKIRESWGE